MLFVALYAKPKVDGVLRLAVGFVPYFESFASSAGKERCVDDLSATHAVRASIAGSASAPVEFSFPDDLAFADLCLAYYVPQVAVPLVTHHWFLWKLLRRLRVYVEMFPCGVNDIVQFRKVLVVGHYQGDLT